MVPVWLLVPVVILGVLVGAALGWWMRQRTLAAEAPQRRWTEEPAPSPPARAVGRGPAPTARAAAPEQRTLGEAPLPTVTVAAPATASGHPKAEPTPGPAPVEQMDLESQPGVRAAAAVQPRDPDPEPDSPPVPEPDPELEGPSEPPAAIQPPPASEGTEAEAERLDARMEDVLSELERRYRGRRVGPGETREEGDPTSRPRRRRPQP